MSCQVFYIVNRKDEQDGKYFTMSSIKNYLCEYEGFDYKTEIIKIAKVDEHISQEIKVYLINILEKLALGDEDKNLLNDFIESDQNAIQIDSKCVNKWINNRRDIEVDFSTVYKVKGETHTATLYLETETSRSSDLKRIMPFFHEKELKNKKRNI